MTVLHEQQFAGSVLYVKENHVCSSLSTVSYECLVCKGEPWLFCMSNRLLGMSCMQRRIIAVLYEQQFARSFLYVKENHGYSSSATVCYECLVCKGEP